VTFRTHCRGILPFSGSLRDVVVEGDGGSVDESQHLVDFVMEADPHRLGCEDYPTISAESPSPFHPTVETMYRSRHVGHRVFTRSPMRWRSDVSGGEQGQAQGDEADDVLGGVGDVIPLADDPGDDERDDQRNSNARTRWRSSGRSELVALIPAARIIEHRSACSECG